eukprot:PhF_6_TR5248/c0_g1_i1/m.7616/K15446/TRM13, CCDC76; tRNA:m4X modification enzyme
MAEGKCTFFLASKNRKCKLDATPGTLFCGIHNPDTSNQRIPCPVNGNHTIFKNKLDEHLQVCPDLKHDPTRLPCYSQGIHVMKKTAAVVPQEHDSATKPEGATTTINEKLLSRIREASSTLEKHVIRVKYEEFRPDVTQVMEEMKSVSEKHTPQHVGLATIMHRLGVLQQSNVFVEMCAGKGGLAAFLKHQYFQDSPATRVIAIDRGSFRRKKDSQHHLERVRIDVADLDFGKLEGVGNDPSKNVVIFGKHACGAATDWTLRCVTESPNIQSNIVCIVIALCCHQLCDAQEYVRCVECLGVQSADEFDKLRHVTSWALESTTSSAGEREELGFMAKRVLNLGRAQHMMTKGYLCALVEYCDRGASKENVALVCVKSSVCSDESKLRELLTVGPEMERPKRPREEQ